MSEHYRTNPNIKKSGVSGLDSEHKTGLASSTLPGDVRPAEPLKTAVFAEHGANTACSQCSQPPKNGFVSHPVIGTALMANGQRYDLVGFRPHTRLDGLATVLAEWSTDCAHCGVTFLALCPSHGFPETRRCEAHRQPGRKVVKVAQ